MKIIRFVSSLAVAILFFDLSLFSQLKVHSGGQVSVGTISTPISTYSLQTIGKSIFSSSTYTATPVSSPVIVGTNSWSSAASPDYTWHENTSTTSTGIFHPATGVIGFSSGGFEKMRVGNDVVINHTSLSKGRLNIYSSGSTEDAARAIWIEVNHGVDWQPAITTLLNRDYGYTYAVRRTSSGADKFYVRGDGLAVSLAGFYNASDASLKTNVRPISNALEKVLGLRGVLYQLKSLNEEVLPFGSLTKNTQMGLIAQEVELVVPEVVATVKDGIKAVAYQNLVGLLIEAIKEQQTKINQLESQVLFCCTTHNSQTISLSENSSFNNDTLSTPRLLQNSPNPFNRQTMIGFYLPTQTKSASLYIFDMQGKLARTVPISTFGNSSVVIDANELSAGMYIYSLIADGKEVDNKRMILTQ